MGSTSSVAKRVDAVVPAGDGHDPWEDMFTNPVQVLAALPTLLHVVVAPQIRRSQLENRPSKSHTSGTARDMTGHKQTRR